jgi:hypothetical protein
MKSALRGQDKLLNSLGEHGDCGHQQSDRDGHEHDGPAVHQCMKQPPRKPSPYRWRPGQSLIVGRARLWCFHGRPDAQACRSPGEPASSSTLIMPAPDRSRAAGPDIPCVGGR